MYVVDRCQKFSDMIKTTGCQVPYIPYLSTQFSIAYDAYLEICRCVNHQINIALRLNMPQLRLKQACPCCFNKLEDEPELEFSCFVSIDGNNSLKRLGSTVRNAKECLDSRTILSDHWISSEDVDRFKDEVRPRVSTFKMCHTMCADFDQSNKPLTDVDIGDDWEDVNPAAGPGLPCINRWRNAGPEEQKKMFLMFEESGIFIASCHH